MEKSIKIDIPEGYEIDEEKSSFTEIVFKKKDTKPRSWDEYCKNNNLFDKYFIGTFNVTCHNDYLTMSKDTNKNLIGSEEEAEAFLVLMQLRQLRKAWVGDWSPIYIKEYSSVSYPIDESRYEKWHIVFDQSWSWVEKGNEKPRALSFPTKKMVEDFLECFKDLIVQAYGLI